MALLNRDALLDSLSPREAVEPSAVFGGELLLRELTRLQHRSLLAVANARPEMQRADAWNAGIFAAGVMSPTSGDPYPDNRRDAAGNLLVDPTTRRPMFTADEVLALPNRSAVFDEVLRVAQRILDLSEVGPDALKSGDPAPDA